MQTARVWGLVKYFHPRVTQCQVAWDRALLDRLPRLEGELEPAALEAILLELLDVAGPTQRASLWAGTPAWIMDAPLSQPTKERLSWLAGQRPSGQCYARFGAAGHLEFPDQAVNPPAPDRHQRLLGAMRYWNIIEYFSPYKSEIGRPWSDVFRQHIAAIADAVLHSDYLLRMRAFTAEIKDSHSFFSATGLTVQRAPPFRLARIDGKPLVTRAQPSAGQVSPGDELLSVNGVLLSQRHSERLPWASGSNPIATERDLLTDASSAPASSAEYRFARPDGSQYSVTLPLSFDNYSDMDNAAGPLWQQRDLAGSCTAGLVDLARLEAADVDAMLEAMRGTDLLVLDIRNYPRGTMWPMVDVLYPRPTNMALLDFPQLDAPGVFSRLQNVLGGTKHRPYAGRIIVLQNETSQSQSEFSIQGFLAIDGSFTVGSQTAGADGNVSSVSLPGGITSWFSGLGVYFPDGRSTQRVGIVPDLHVAPSPAGLAAGQDEVLDAALDCRWISERPAKRSAHQGMYWQPARSGEGFDLVQAEGQLAVFSYGFDAEGEPEWLLGVAPVTAGEWPGTLSRFSSSAAPAPAGLALNMDFHRGPYEPACAQIDQLGLHPRARFSWPPEQPETACLEPFILADAGGFSGSWAGPDEELGWGVNLHQSEGLLHAVLFVFDAAGKPRWLLGSAPFSGSGQVEIPMNRFTGFCRQCETRELGIEAAGQLTLDLRQSSNDLGAGNLLSVDVQPAAGSVWQRDSMPIRRLSDELR